MSPSSKPQGLRLYYPNNYLGSVGVHLLALVQHWLESLLGFIGLEAQTLTSLRRYMLQEGWRAGGGMRMDTGFTATSL